ncbi:MAG: acyl-CoA dehydrogenase family protein [Alphaproteobacteria bacterium]
MEFGLSDDQKLLENSFRRLTEDKLPLERIREFANARTGFNADIWKSLVDLAATGVLIPEQYGGAGFTMLDAIVILESLGRTVTPAPFTGSAIMAPVALLTGGTEAQKEQWLPQIAAGEVKFGVGVTEIISTRDSNGVSLSGDTLSGNAMFVLDGGPADIFLLAAGPDNMAIVPRNAPGVTVTQLTTIDYTRMHCEVKLEGVKADLLGGRGKAAGAIGKTILAGRLALAADTLGAADVMIYKAVEYAKERKQFDRVIASYQAVKHMCAEMIAELEPFRSLVWYAAHAYDEVPVDALVYGLLAKSGIDEAGKFIIRTATEVHGGMGFTDLMGLHYWYKRVSVNRALLGTPEILRNEAAIAQGWLAA